MEALLATNFVWYFMPVITILVISLLFAIVTGYPPINSLILVMGIASVMGTLIGMILVEIYL